MRQSVDRRLDLQFDNLWILPVRVLLSEALLVSYSRPTKSLGSKPHGLASMQFVVYTQVLIGVIVPVLPFVWPSVMALIAPVKTHCL